MDLTTITAQWMQPEMVGYELREWLRSCVEKEGNTNPLIRINEDTHFVNGSVDKHTDATERGHDTTFMVLVDDCDSTFHLTNGVSVKLDVGMVVRFDARKEHFTTVTNPNGRLALIIWDCPIEKDFSLIVEGLMARLEYLNQSCLSIH